MTVTSEGGQVTDALKGKLTFEQSKDRIVGRDELNLARLLILANGTEFVMKVSQDGVDVLTGSDDDMVFNSNNNLFKIVDSGNVSFASPNLIGSSTNVSVAHTLGYNPIVIAFVSITGPTGTAQPLPVIGPQLTADPTPGLIKYQIAFETVGGNTITFFPQRHNEAYKLD